MSASREKKQRQATSEPTLSPRAQEELEKEARRKRNTIIYSIIGAVVVILAAILLIWDSGVIQRNTTVATIDGEKVTAPQVAYYYYNNPVILSAQTYSQYGLSGFPYSLSLSPKEQVITDSAASYLGLDEAYVGLTYHEYFLTSALASLREEYALRAAAEEAGYTLSEEGKQSVEQELEDLDSMLDQYLSVYGVNMSRSSYLQQAYGKTMSESKYRTCLTNAMLADEFYDAYFDTLTAYTDEELEAYYLENQDSLDTVSYYWRFFDGAPEETTDEDGNTVEATEEETEAAMAQAKADAEALQTEIGGDVDVVKDNEDFTEATGVLSNTSSFYYDWVIDPDRAAGDSTVFETDSGYYLVIFADRYRDETPTVNVRHILVEASHEDDPDTEDVDESTEDPTDEDFAAAEEKALDILEQWKAGEATEESFAALAEEYSADPGSNTNGGLYEKVYEGRMIDAFNNWIFDPARQNGDVSDPIKNDQSSTQGWHLIYFIGQDEPVWKTSVRENKWFEDLAGSVEIVTNDSRLDSLFD